LDPLIQAIGNSSYVLIGEASHGTHEFYAIRAEITKRLIQKRGFLAVAVEANWPMHTELIDTCEHAERTSRYGKRSAISYDFRPGCGAIGTSKTLSVSFVPTTNSVYAVSPTWASMGSTCTA
jgi:hypothetical protein